MTLPAAARLTAQRCEACNSSTPRLSTAEIDDLRPGIAAEWTVAHDRKLFRRFAFKDFARAFAFTERIAALAEEEGHHPDMRVGWGYVEVESQTHAIGGLSTNDFILAAKIDQLER